MNSYKIIDLSIIMNKFITVKEFAEIYGIGINSAYSIARINGFPKIKVGNRIYIVKSKLDDWVINNIGNEFWLYESNPICIRVTFSYEKIQNQQSLLI